MRNCLFSSFLAASLAFSIGSIAADAPSQGTKRTKWRWELMDNGPFFSSNLDGPISVLKAITVKLGKDEEAAAAFDTMNLRMAGGWEGGFLQLPKGRDGLEGLPKADGKIAFRTPSGPGWSVTGDFTDPRPTPYQRLPDSWAKYRGLFVNGNDVIFSYTVAGSGVLEMPGYDSENDLRIFTRTIQIEPTKSPLSLMVCEERDVASNQAGTTAVLNLTNGTSVLAAGIIGKVDGARFEVLNNKQIVLRLPQIKKRTTFAVAIWKGDSSGLSRFTQYTSAEAKLPDLTKFCKGGPGHWGAPLSTKGTLGTGDGPYVVDTLTLPEPNPYNSWMRTSGFDFFSEGRAAVCSVSGDVWIVSGINDKLEKLTWRRYATGLFQPLGLKIVNDKVYVLGRDQITRLDDLNKDGEADSYECFNNDIQISREYHEFALCLETDSKGNFYFNKGGNLGQAAHDHHGCLIKVSKDGKKLEVVATGLRAPNGMGIGPRDEIATSDNEGNWVPACRVNLMKPGGFYGHVFTAHRKPNPTNYDVPLFWIPKSMDNSSGGEVWVTSDKWGPLKGQMLHASYGTCLLFSCVGEEINGIPQGGAIKFPLKFDSGIMRSRFNKKDGQLYTTGLVVWQSNGARQGAFHRVRYTGKPVDMPVALHVKKNGIEFTFTNPLDAKTAADDQNYSVEEWNYKWTQNYGSPEFSVKNPDVKAHDPVPVKSVKLSADRKTVFLEIPEIHTVMQMKIRYSLKSADGRDISQEIYNTINVVPKN